MRQPFKKPDTGKQKKKQKKEVDLQLGSNAEELPRPRTVSGNLPSQSLDPGILYMIKDRKNGQK